MTEQSSRTDRRDGDGYYKALGVPVSASREEIKAAFRHKAKDLHPDHNQRVDATEAFQHLVSAYQVLSDSEARARYDAAASSPRAGGGGGSGRAKVAVDPVKCCRCGAVPEQPRFVIFWYVVGTVVGARRQAVQGVFCRSCADIRALWASLVTWLFGWWGLPWAPLWSVAALWGNFRGGEQPPDVNATLLLQQARYFVVSGKRGLARSTLDQALGLAKQPELRQKLQKMARAVGDGPRARRSDHWQLTASSTYYLQLALGIVGGVGLVYELGRLIVVVARLIR